MVSLFFRNLLFTIIHPGIVAGLIPYLILGDKVNSGFVQPLQIHQYAGAMVFIMGFIILLNCIVNFAVRGRGTLSPADPTKKLVISGLYRLSRNPMYASVMLILAGEAIFFRSVNLWIYSIVVFIGFNIFILLFEEPRLRKDFGEEYKTYCKKVRRWI
jgi:protein-S-isoprenylcysteine O-methyltransferase Ste14